MLSHKDREIVKSLKNANEFLKVSVKQYKTEREKLVDNYNELKIKSNYYVDRVAVSNIGKWSVKINKLNKVIDTNQLSMLRLINKNNNGLIITNLSV